MRQKTKQSSNIKTKAAKRLAPKAVNDWQDFLNPDAHRFYPGLHEARQRLIYTLIEWARDEKNVEIGRFCAEHSIIPQTMDLWRSKHEDLNTAWQQAKRMLASNRRHGCIKKNFEMKAAFRDIHLYDKAEDEINKYHAELSKNSSHEKGDVTITVIDSKPEVQSAEDLKKDQDV